MPSGSNNILAKMAVLISANNAEFNRALADSSAKLLGFERGFMSLGKTLASGLGFYGATQAITEIISRMAQFQHSMQEVKAITGATGEEFKALKDNALNLAGAFKAIDISKMEVELGRLGFTTEEILDTTKTAILLATATGENLAKSADVLGSTLRAFNLSASESKRVGEVMASGFNKSALSLENFSEAIKYVAPVAANANISLEQTVALLGVLADNGIRGSMAGTSLRKIISDLGQGAGPILNQKLREMAAAGISSAQAMDEVGRTAYASLLILANNTNKIDAFTTANLNANGELQRMADIMQDDLVGDWNKLNAEIDRMIQSKGGISQLFRVLVQGATDFLKIMNNDAVAEFDRQFSGQGLWKDLVTGKLDDDFLKRVEESAKKAGIEIRKVWNNGVVIGFERLDQQTGVSGPFPADKFEVPPPPITPGNKPAFKDTTMIDIYKVSVFQDMKKDALDAASAVEFLQKEMKGLKEFVIEWDEIEADVMHEKADPEVTKYVDNLIEKWKDLKKHTANMGLSMKQIGSLMRQELNNIAFSFGQMLGNIISSTNGANLGKVLLGEIGQIMVQLGKMLIAVGIGVEKFKESLKSLNGTVAIAAGIALVALGTAFANAASSAGGGGSVSSNASRAADQIRQPLEIHIAGELQAKNGVLTAVLQHEGYVRKRTGG